MKTKRILSVLLALAMIISLVPTVSFADATLTITGSDKFISISGSDRYSKMPYTIKTADSTDVSTTAEVVVEKDGQTASDAWFIDGNLIVKSGAEGTYILKATSGTETGEKTITVTKSTLYDWETAATSLGTGATDTDAKDNVYAAGTSTARLNLSTDNTLENGIKTVEYKFKVPTSYTTAGDVIADNAWKMYVKKTATSSDKFSFENKITNYNGSTYNKYIKTGLAIDTWYEMRFVYDLDASTYTVYFGDDASANATNLNLISGQSTSSYKFYMGIDDLVVYSGTECPSPISVTVAPGKSVLIPQTAGNAKIQLSAEAPLLPAGAYTWSLVGSPAGVSLDSATGILSVTQTAEAGEVTVKATKNGYEGTATVTLIKMLDEFSEGQTISAGTVVADSANAGNYYIQNSTNTRYNHADIPYSNDGISTVYDMRVRGDRCTFYLITDKGWVGNAQMSSFSKYDSWTDKNTWFNLKVIINPKTNKFTALIADENGGESEYVELSEYSITSSSSINYISANYVDIDSIKIYNISDTTPSIAKALVDNVTVGQEAKIYYDFISLDGAADASEYAWSISDSEDGSYETIDGETAKTINVTSDMAGKYLKATITPKHLGQFGDVITGTPVEVKAKVKSELSIKYFYRDSYDSQNDTVFVPGDAVPDDKYLVATVEITQMDATPRNVMIAIAKYTDDGSYLEMSDHKYLSTQAQGASDSNSIVISETGGNIKVFVWDKETLKPIKCDIIK